MYLRRFEKWQVPKKYSKSSQKNRLPRKHHERINEDDKAMLIKHLRTLKSTAQLHREESTRTPISESEADHFYAHGKHIWKSTSPGRHDEPLGYHRSNLINDESSLSQVAMEISLSFGSTDYTSSGDASSGSIDDSNAFREETPMLYPPLEVADMRRVLASVQVSCFRAKPLALELHNPGPFWDNIYHGIYFIQIGSPNRAWPAINEACTLIAEAISSNESLFIKEMFMALSPVNPVACPELRIQLLRYIKGMAMMRLGKTHPITIICDELLLHEHDGEVAERSLAFMADQFDKELGTSHPISLGANQYLVRYFRKKRDQESITKSITHGHKLLSTATNVLGPQSSTTRQVARELEHVYIDNGQLLQALELCHLIVGQVNPASNLAEPSYKDEWSVYTMEDIAKIYEELGNGGMSIAWLQEAAMGAWGLWKDWAATRHIVDKLEAALTRDGRHNEAMNWIRARHWT
jgi:hypothetical protein